MMNFNDITITSLETITGFNITTGEYLFTLDELQNATINNTQEETDITGKQGRKLSKLKRNKAMTVSGSNGLLSGGLLAMQTGSDFKNEVTEVLWTDYITIKTAGEAETAFKAVGTAGSEVELYKKDGHGTLVQKFEQADAAASGKFAYDNASKKITFNAGEANVGDEFVAYYKRKITADVLENNSDIYSAKCMLYIDALAEDKCARVYRVQFFIPKADFSGEFSVEMGDNQLVHDFEAEGLAGTCGTGGVLWTYTIFGEDTEDAA